MIKIYCKKVNIESTVLRRDNEDFDLMTVQLSEISHIETIHKEEQKILLAALDIDAIFEYLKNFGFKVVDDL